jgi:hypothetical protein
MSVRVDPDTTGGSAPLVGEEAGDVVPLGRRTVHPLPVSAATSYTPPCALRRPRRSRPVPRRAAAVLTGLLAAALVITLLTTVSAPQARPLRLSGFNASLDDVSTTVGERLSSADHALRRAALERRRAASRRAEERAVRRARAERQHRAARARARERAAAASAAPPVTLPAPPPQRTPAPRQSPRVAPEFAF